MKRSEEERGTPFFSGELLPCGGEADAVPVTDASKAPFLWCRLFTRTGQDRAGWLMFLRSTVIYNSLDQQLSVFRRQPLKDCLCVRVCLMGVPVTKIRWVLKSYCLCVLTETSLVLSPVAHSPPAPSPNGLFAVLTFTFTAFDRGHACLIWPFVEPMQTNSISK